jgi:hypothetical protein
VFPKLWINPRTDRRGYAPACANEWVRGVCEKPRVKCSECPNQAFVPMSDQVVLDHLQGRHVIGVYPLLEDDTCWFLAADFDEESWADDVAALVETSRALGLPSAVERSRSGNGAHVCSTTGSCASRPVGVPGAIRRCHPRRLKRSPGKRVPEARSSAHRLLGRAEVMCLGGAAIGNCDLPDRRPAGESAVLAQRLFVEKAGSVLS